MNAPFTPPTKAEQEVRKLAADILAGDTQPYGKNGKNGMYSAREWIAAAHYLTDSDDWSEVSYMMGQEELGPECERWADEADYRYDLMRDEQMLAAEGC